MKGNKTERKRIEKKLIEFFENNHTTDITVKYNDALVEQAGEGNTLRIFGKHPLNFDEDSKELITLYWGNTYHNQDKYNWEITWDGNGSFTQYYLNGNSEYVGQSDEGVALREDLHSNYFTDLDRSEFTSSTIVEI